MANKSTNTSIINQLKEYIEDSEYTEGLEHYHNKCIRNTQKLDQLYTCEIFSDSRGTFKISLRMNLNNSAIQWIECSCLKNRKAGKYCSHIIAFLVYLNNLQLNKTVNFSTVSIPKPPHIKKKVVPIASFQEASPIDLFMTSNYKTISSVNFLNDGPTLRVRYSLNDGIQNYKDLNLDAAAIFLSNIQTHKIDASHLFDITLHNTNTTLVTYLFPKNNSDSIESIKGLCIECNEIFSMNSQDILQDGILILSDKIPRRKINYLFFPLDSTNIQFGQQYCFIPKIGFFPFFSSKNFSILATNNTREIYANDLAAQLVQNGFKSILANSPILLEKTLANSRILTPMTISNIEISNISENWFYISPTYILDDRQISLVDLISQLRNRKRKFLKNGDDWISIPDHLKESNLQICPDRSSIKASKIDLLKLNSEMGEKCIYKGNIDLIEKVKKFSTLNNNSPLPSLLHTNLTLRDYQLDGVNWLWWLYQNGLHGLLADEMGLGKTHQAMAILSAIQKEDDCAQFLVICPTTVLDHWRNKISTFSPNLSPLIYHGQKRSFETITQNRKSKVVLTSYGVIIRDINKLVQIEWKAIILDEAHFVKNHATSTYNSVCKLNSKFKLCLTGTPLENHLGELKNIFDFLLPGYLGSLKYFKQRFQDPIEQKNDPHAAFLLQQYIKPFKCRRIKKEVLADLPNKVEDLRYCSLSQQQVIQYNSILSLRKQTLLDDLKNSSAPIPYMHIFATLSLLKQICNHPALINPNFNYKNSVSNKFELLKEIINEALASDLKIVIFSQYLKMIDIIREYLCDQNIQHLVLTGQTKDRGKVIENFQSNSQIKVFIASLLAGGTGIDLTAASVVIHYDRWWNSSKEDQASDRVHRIGQNKNVQIMKLVTKGTLEEKISQLIEKKKHLIDQFVGNDGATLRQLSRNELIELLSSASDNSP